jgi:hypothetical protein
VFDDDVDDYNHNVCRLLSTIIFVTAGQCPLNEAVRCAWRRIKRCRPGVAAASAVFSSDISFITRRCGFKTGGVASCNRTSTACTSMHFPSLTMCNNNMHMLGDKWAYAVSGRRENLERNAGEEGGSKRHNKDIIRVTVAESPSPRHKVSTAGSGSRAEPAVAHNAVAKHVRFAERKSATGVFIPAGMDVMKGVHEEVPVHRKKGGAAELEKADHAPQQQQQHQQQQQYDGHHPPPNLTAASTEGSTPPSIICLVNRSKHAAVEASSASPVISTPSAGVAHLLLQLPERSTLVDTAHVTPSKISEEQQHGGGDTSVLHRPQQHQLPQQQQQQQQDDERQQYQQRPHINYHLFDNRSAGDTNVWEAVANAGYRRTSQSTRV